MFKTDKECIGFLKYLDAQFAELLELLGERPERLLHDQIEKARDMLRVRKDDLRGYYQTNQSQRAKAAMLPIEKVYCFPAVHEALTAIRVTPNHRPSGKWIHELADARDTIQYYLEQLLR